MKIIRGFLLLVALTLIMTSCDTSSSTPSVNSLTDTTAKPPETTSPFAQFETLKRVDMGIDGEQADNILRSYGIYDRIRAKVPEEVPIDSFFSDVSISGFSIGNKKAAVLLLSKGHIYIYVMFSNSGDKWIASGFAYQNERDDKPEYRIEQSGDGTKYWLVVKHEANHGTGLYIYDEIWYNPDGSIAAEYPLEGSTLFFPESIKPNVNTYFSAYAHYDGDSMISLSYSINFVYGYKDNFQNFDDVYKFQSEYSPVIREYWEYDLKAHRLEFVSCDPALPAGFSAMKHEASAEYGILQGYIDFYRARLGDKTITTLAEWEKFMGLK